MESILITIGTDFAEKGKEILDAIGTTTYKQCNRTELLSMLQDVTILVVGLDHVVDAELIDSAPGLRIIATATTGTDHIDLRHAESKGITVLSLYNETDFLRGITSTAELALGLMIDLSRKTHSAVQSVQQGEWNRDAFVGHSLSGKTLGIIGLGRLGTLMARYGKALGMNVVYTDPHASSAECTQLSFDELLGKSDIVSIHVPLNEETENMLNAEAFKKMKPSAYLINTSRGKVVNEKDLIEALEKSHVAGYAADVLAEELSFESCAECPLIDYAKAHDNVILTPHIGGNTIESREATDIFIAQKIQSFLSS